MSPSNPTIPFAREGQCAILIPILLKMIRKLLTSVLYWLTWPFKRLYALIGKKRVEEFELQPIKLGAKIICVGNITLGGTGKTPTVRWIVEQIKRLHPAMKVGVHLRGYRGEMENIGGIVSDGKKIYAGPREAGDEAFLMARELLELGIPVAVGKHKAEAGAAMIDRFGLDVLVFDDAYQFTSLARDLNVLLIDALRPFGEAGFPREGMMREPLESLSRADVVILTRTELISGGDLKGIINRIKPYLRTGTHIFLSSFIPQSLSAIKSGYGADTELLMTRRAMPLSAIGNPRGFELMLEKLGMRLVKPLRYADHHRYTSKDIQYINKRVLEEGAHIILTTEKDAVRLGRRLNELHAPVYSIPIKFEMRKEEEFLEILNQVLRNTITVKQSESKLKSDAGERIFSVKEDYERLSTDPRPAKTEGSSAMPAGKPTEGKSPENYW